METYKGISNKINDMKDTQKLFAKTEYNKNHGTHGMIFSSMLFIIILAVVIALFFYLKRSMQRFRTNYNNTVFLHDVEKEIENPKEESKEKEKEQEKRQATTTYKSFSK
jgi:uncharacterized membrane protein